MILAFKGRSNTGLPGNSSRALSVATYQVLGSIDGVWEGMGVGGRRDSLAGHLVMALADQLYKPYVVTDDS